MKFHASSDPRAPIFSGTLTLHTASASPMLCIHYCAPCATPHTLIIHPEPHHSSRMTRSCLGSRNYLTGFAHPSVPKTVQTALSALELLNLPLSRHPRHPSLYWRSRDVGNDVASHARNGRTRLTTKNHKLSLGSSLRLDSSIAMFQQKFVPLLA